MNGSKQAFAAIPQCSQLVRLLSAFTALCSREVKLEVFSRMVAPPDFQQVELGRWNPSLTASMYFISMHLPSVVDESMRLEWFLSNFLVLTRQSPTATVASCARGIARHPEFHGAHLSSKVLEAAADTATTVLVQGRCTSVPTLAALIGLVASTLPYLKQASRFKQLFATVARLAQSPDLSYPIGELCSDCGLLQLEVLQDIPPIFRALFAASPSGPGLWHTMRCYTKFALVCPNPTTVVESMPPEHFAEFEAFQGGEQPPQQRQQQEVSGSQTPVLTPPDANAGFDKISQLIGNLVECVRGLPPEARLPETVGAKVEQLSSLLNAHLTKK